MDLNVLTGYVQASDLVFANSPSPILVYGVMTTP
jgi:hypothetical protein